MRRHKPKILVIHGPNLHLLGKREKEIYGNFTLSDIDKELKFLGEKNHCVVKIFQSNSEGTIIDKITSADYDFLIINPAGYTHTSIAIRDAILASGKPAIEVHISNISKREEFRKKSLISDIVIGTITGLGKQSYTLALLGALEILREQKTA